MGFVVGFCGGGLAPGGVELVCGIRARFLRWWIDSWRSRAYPWELRNCSYVDRAPWPCGYPCRLLHCCSANSPRLPLAVGRPKYEYVEQSGGSHTQQQQQQQVGCHILCLLIFFTFFGENGISVVLRYALCFGFTAKVKVVRCAPFCVWRGVAYNDSVGSVYCVAPAGVVWERLSSFGLAVCVPLPFLPAYFSDIPAGI